MIAKRAFLLVFVVAIQLRAYALMPGAHIQPRTIHYYCCKELEGSFKREFERWNKAIDGYFTLVKVAENEADIKVVTAHEGELDKPTYLGESDGDTIRILWPLPDGYDVEPVMLHEIGHQLGFHHSKDENSIMYPTLDPEKKPELNAEDKHQVRKVYLGKD